VWQAFLAAGLRAPAPQRQVHVHHHGVPAVGYEFQNPDAE
jgi:hypothetical protein